MQGSVAHAMQLTIRKVWERLGHRLLMEGHDSLVVTASPDAGEIKATISAVVPIMLHPFQDVLPDNPAFPLKVSIGKRWKKWKLYATYRQSGVEYAKPVSSAEPAAAEGGGEEAKEEGTQQGQEGGTGQEEGSVVEPGDPGQHSGGSPEAIV